MGCSSSKPSINYVALTSLNLFDNSIGAEGAKAIADALCVNGSLTSLDVGSNYRMGKEAVLSLVSIFKEKDQMQSVGLAGCSLGDNGAKAVADYVIVSGSLTSLLLGGNSIGPEGAKAIGESLRVNGSLTSLNLNYNDIGVEGAKLDDETKTLLRDAVKDKSGFELLV